MSLKEIRERLEAASPGPWWHNLLAAPHADPPDLALTWRVGDVDGIEVAVLSRDDQGWADAEFIANARHDIERLLAVADVAWAEHGDLSHREHCAICDALNTLTTV